MAYRPRLTVWALGATLLGCGSGEFELDADSPGTESTSGASEATGSARDVDGDGAPGIDAAGSSWTTVGDSSGGVEEGGGQPTTFGMSDDMPLVADIPDIKRGRVGEGAWIMIEQVRPSTGRAELGGDAWFYVQDPVATEYMGLRVSVLPGDDAPAANRWVDLVGYVSVDDQGGWLLQLDTVVESGVHPGVRPVRVHVSDLTASSAVIYDDSVVELYEPNLLRVTRQGPVAGTVLVGWTPTSSGAVLVDLRPFGLEGLDLPTGTLLSRVRGVAEIGGSRPVILPRTSDDLVVAG